MAKESLKKKILSAILVVPTACTLATATGCAKTGPKKHFYNREITGQQLIYDPGKDLIFTNTPNRMEIRSPDGLVRIMEDYDHSGKINDHPKDKFIVKNGNCSVTYTIDYVIDKDGNIISGDDPIAKAALLESKEQMKTANEVYSWGIQQVAKDVKEDLQKPCQ